MKIHLGCDHAGFELKEKVATHLKNNGHEVIDHGAKTYDALDDYPVFCFLASQAAAKDSNSLAIVIGGSGNGEQIAANKIKENLIWQRWHIATCFISTYLINSSSMSFVVRKICINKRINNC